MPRLHYFNPGHEMAILLGKENYTPTRNVQKMRKELAFLPVWYADPEDYVLVPNNYAPRFFSNLPKALRPFAKVVTPADLKQMKESLPPLEATPWGISPDSLAYFRQLQEETGITLSIPEWKEAYRQLTSRKTAAACLDEIRNRLPDMELPYPPKFCTRIEDVDKYLRLKNAPFVLKTPFSSSGRGLYWLTERKLMAKDRVWLRGALSKQGTVSIESGLDRFQDLAMEFYSDGEGHLRFEALSAFGTSSRGAYQGNALESQEAIRFGITKFVGEETFQQIQAVVQQVLQETYASIYKGYLGVDMMVYRDKQEQFHLHPCVEVNMRYTMGLLAHKLAERCLPQKKIGDTYITYFSKEGEALAQHNLMKKAYPLELAGDRIVGYMPLCPVTKEVHYLAYMIIM
ncbi:MAG: hypothetical protein ACI30I_03260 [Parabacteroides sp.]